MLGTYFYNEVFRKTVIAFGTLFNNIEVRKYKTNGKVDYKRLKAYAMKELGIAT